MFGKLGPWEIGLILVIILIVFGVGKLPQVGGAIGKGVRAFRKAQSGEDEEEEKTKAKPTVQADDKKKE
ncbi:MAG: twin-arginine translocase TatA/TatE family subunit [Chloroflexi bacterium]|nr:twin-arginine translocase TatA/TatE family subunit [Chloroflexota bacterium]